MGMRAKHGANVVAGLVLILICLSVAIAFLLLQPSLNAPNQPQPTPIPTATTAPSPSLQTIHYPLVPPTPEFTIQYIDYSFEVTPTTPPNSIPPQNLPSYPVDNRTIILSIKTPTLTTNYTDIPNEAVYYNVRYKNHSATDWITFYPSVVGYPTMDLTSNITKITYTENSFLKYVWEKISYKGGTFDFQAQTLIGKAGLIPQDTAVKPWYFSGKTSDWSSTQIITIPSKPLH
jgi:hypothetical protein